METQLSGSLCTDRLLSEAVSATGPRLSDGCAGMPASPTGTGRSVP